MHKFLMSQQKNISMRESLVISTSRIRNKINLRENFAGSGRNNWYKTRNKRKRARIEGSRTKIYTKEAKEIKLFKGM